MNITLTGKDKIMGGIFLALILLFFIREGCNQIDKNNLVTNLATYEDSAKYYTMKVDGMEVEVAQNKSLVLENKKQFESVIAKNDTLLKLVSKFKDIQSGTIINNYTTINNDTIKLRGDSIPCDFKAFKVRRDSVHYHFVGTIAKTYFTIDSLVIPNKQSIIIGKKKLGFLKGYEERAEIINSNPLVRVTNIESYVINKKKKKMGLGASVGYGFSVGNQIRLSPYIGLSLNYNLIEF